jgi:serine/threonine-protein kinase
VGELLRRLFARLDPALEPLFARELDELHRRRLRVLLPLMCLLHLAHALFFYVPQHVRAALPPDVLRWRDGLVLAHGIMVPIIATLVLLGYPAARVRRMRWIAPVAGAVYLQHGAFVAGIDQIVSSNISAYIGYDFGIAVVLYLSPRLSVLLYAAGFASLQAALLLFQRSSSARLTNLPTSVTLTVFSVAFAWHLYRARRREFVQRATIERQREELAALNATLSERVRAQVAEIMDRASEVERLNNELRAQVRARSHELSLALSRLASERNADGSLPAGLVLAGRFELGAPVGFGGMSTVYAGVDRQTSARVAIKVIQARSSDQLDAMRRFIREVGMAATVAHPAVVRMIHVDVSDDGLLFQVQELVDGVTLTAWGRPWSPPEAARLGAVLCEALAAAHAVGVVHRDVKPENIMLVDVPPGLKLLDFGIAKLFDAVAQPLGATTDVRMVIGTPGYMAPEQAHGQGDISDRADLYAVGVILLQLLTGVMPTDPIRALATARPSLPIELPRVIERCMCDEARARPAAEAVARELARFADAEAAPALDVIVRRGLADGLLARRPVAASHPTTPHRRGAV